MEPPCEGRQGPARKTAASVRGGRRGREPEGPAQPDGKSGAARPRHSCCRSGGSLFLLPVSWKPASACPLVAEPPAQVPTERIGPRLAGLSRGSAMDVQQVARGPPGTDLESERS